MPKRKDKQNETMLSMTIQTGYYHTDGNRFEVARQRVEKAGFYVQSIFNLIRLSTDAFETVGTRKIDYYLDDLRHLSEIGSGIADSVFSSTMAFLEVEEDDPEDVPKKKKRRK